MNLAGGRATLSAFGHIQDVHRRARQRSPPLDTRTFNYTLLSLKLRTDGAIQEATILAANVCLRLNQYAPFPYRPEATTIVTDHQHRDPDDRAKAHTTDDPLKGVLFLRSFDHVGQSQHGTARTFGQTDQRQEALSHF